MTKILLSLIAVMYGLNALVMWFAPEFWYEITPGVSMMGPFNLHFIRDIALIYLLAAAIFIWVVRNGNQSAGYVAAAWPCMHALFHVQIWMARGFPFDEVTAGNVLGIQLPAWGTLYLISKLSPPKGVNT